jgi:putative transcription factor
MSKLSCDICGRDDVRAVILLEGAKMLACGSCMRSGKVIHRLDQDDGKPLVREKPPPRGMEETREIVEDYGRRIKNARDKAQLRMAVVAERIKEKESYLDAIENQRIMPTFEVAKKLEKELNIKLIEKVDTSSTASVDTRPAKFKEPTLADMLLAQKKKES